MKFTKQKFEKPITGTGVVKVAEKSFTIDLTYKDEKDREQEEKFTFKLSEMPDNLPDGWELKSGKEYWASISNDGSTLLNLRPAKGTFKVKSTSISETKDGEYLVIIRDGQYGKFAQFVPLLTVQEGANKGIDFPLYLPYGSEDKPRFSCDDSGMMQVTGNPDKSRGVSMLFDWLTYTGIADQDLEYPMDGNDPDDDPQAVLGVLDKAVRHAKKVFTVLIENGYPKSLAEIEDDETEAEEEPEEKPAKPSGKKKWSED